MNYQWDFSSVFQAYPVLLEGLWNTLCSPRQPFSARSRSALSSASAAPRAVLCAGSRAAYVEMFRNVPVLIQLFMFFYLVPLFFGISNNTFLVAAVTLSLYKGAFVAEIYRSGIQSIERGQWDAARALGLALRRPDALCRIAASDQANDPGLYQSCHRDVQTDHGRLAHRLSGASLSDANHRRFGIPAARILHHSGDFLRRRRHADLASLRRASKSGSEHRIDAAGGREERSSCPKFCASRICTRAMPGSRS